MYFPQLQASPFEAHFKEKNVAELTVCLAILTSSRCAFNWNWVIL